MTTQTPKRAPATKPRTPAKVDTTPANMKRWRPVITVLSLLMMLAGAFYVAFALGRDRQIYSGAGMFLIGLSMAVFSQLRVTYAWADRDKPPVVQHADQAPAGRKTKTPRQRRRPAAQLEIPTVKPAWSLSPEFRYIVTYARWLAAEHPEVFGEMSQFWDTIDWDSDETDSEYRDVVEFLYDVARAMPGWDDNATHDDLIAGTVARDNPFVFVAEAESYHALIAAVAVLMLTRSDSRVTTEDFDQVLKPWTDLGLSYRLSDMVFSLDRDGEYQAKEVEARRPAPAAPGSVAATAVVDVTDGAARPPAVNFDAPAPARATPAPALPPAPAPTPSPAAPAPSQSAAQEKHVEGDRDDVPEPDSDLVVHAAELVITAQLGSASMIQRKQRVGFALASKIMYRLNFYGVVGEPNSAGANRKVMVGVEELEDTLDFIREQEAERHNS